MEIRSINIYKSSRYENNELKDFYKVTIRLNSSKETDIEIQLNGEEQKALFKAISEILPAKLNEFNQELQQNLQGNANENMEEN